MMNVGSERSSLMIEIAAVGANDNLAATMASFVPNLTDQQRLFNASEEEKENLYMALNSKYEITDVLPPPNHDDVQVLVMAVGYMLLFLLGTCGNVAVLTTIYQVVRSRRNNLDNTLIYVIVLSCVDFGVCLSLPFTVIDQILGFWMFGSIVCKLHAVLENFGKILSALILTAMSFDRFAGVCHPHKKWLRSTSLAVIILVGMAVYALVTLCPLLWSFTARELVLFEKETAPHKITRMRIEKCTMVNISSTVFTLFTVFLFVLCYLVPLFLVAFFYSRLLKKLRQHARQFTSSQIPLMRISLYTLAVACFYFICWTPFWVATAFAVYLEYAGEQGGTVPPVFVYCMYFIHALPFTNSAVNWILYGALNSQLQHRYRGNRTNENTTLVQNGHSTCPTLKTIPSINGISLHKNTNESQKNNHQAFDLGHTQPLQTGRTYLGSESSCVQLSTINGNVPQYQSTNRWLSNSNQSTNTTNTPAIQTPVSRRPSFQFPTSIPPIAPVGAQVHPFEEDDNKDKNADLVDQEVNVIPRMLIDYARSGALDGLEESYPFVGVTNNNIIQKMSLESDGETYENDYDGELMDRRESIDLLLKSDHEATFL